MSSVIRIRPATSEDVAAILPMVRELTRLHETHDPERFKVRPDILDRYASWLPQRITDPRSVLLVAADADAARLVGFVVGTIEPEIPIYWVPECGWVHDVWVEPSHRGRGVATALVNAAAERFGALGVAQLRLHTAIFNEPARKAFAGAGFRPCVIEMLRTLTTGSP